MMHSMLLLMIHNMSEMRKTIVFAPLFAVTFGISVALLTSSRNIEAFFLLWFIKNIGKGKQSCKRSPILDLNDLDCFCDCEKRKEKERAIEHDV